jgi:prophage regulatory protein
MAERFLRTRAVLERVGLSRTTLWRMERAGDFPARRIVGGGVVGWVESEVDQWITSRPAAPGTEESGGRRAA